MRTCLVLEVQFVAWTTSQLFLTITFSRSFFWLSDIMRPHEGCWSALKVMTFTMCPTCLSPTKTFPPPGKQASPPSRFVRALIFDQRCTSCQSGITLPRRRTSPPHSTAASLDKREHMYLRGLSFCLASSLCNPLVTFRAASAERSQSRARAERRPLSAVRICLQSHMWTSETPVALTRVSRRRLFAFFLVIQDGAEPRLSSPEIKGKIPAATFWYVFIHLCRPFTTQLGGAAVAD